MADEYILKSTVLNYLLYHSAFKSKSEIMQDIAECESADVVRVRHGKWYHSECDKFKCGLCGYAFTVIQGADRMHYCPNCGAKMYGEDWEKTKKQSAIPEDEYVRMHKDPEAARKFWRNE